MERTSKVAEQRGEASRKISVVDSDVHPHFRRGLQDLKPYLSTAWQRGLRIGEEFEWARDIYAAQFSIPKNVLYINTAGVLRRDSVPPDNSMPASDPAFVARQLLDEYGIDRAILIGGNVLGLGAIPDAALATAIASAYNDWLTDVWLGADERYRGALVVAVQDPSRAAAEIDRVGDRRGMVAVLLPLTNMLMGNPHHYPIYEAAARHGLPVAVHPNSVDGMFVTAPPLAGGAPTYYLEWHTGLTQIFQANVISLVCHGVFEKIPDLRVVITEGGIGWLPDVMWRLDKNWRSLRDEVPWLRRLPSEYIVEHMRFTTQPFIEPARSEHVRWLCDIIQADRTLLFSSDYPHWDFDNPLRAFHLLPEEMKQKFRRDNPVALYGARLV